MHIYLNGFIFINIKYQRYIIILVIYFCSLHTCIWMFQCIFFVCIYIYIYIYISSSSCRAASTNFPDPLSPPVSIVHRFPEVFQAISCIGTELVCLGFSLSSYHCSSMWKRERKIDKERKREIERERETKREKEENPGVVARLRHHKWVSSEFEFQSC